jgi:murein DD-endopeptidase MepM/ murein hydrolase activator NlpD
MRSGLLLLTSVLAAVGLVGPAAAGRSTSRVVSGYVARSPASPVSYVAPVPEPLDVVRGFDPPTTPYGRGHLGVDLAVRSGQLVRSAGTGIVSFAGSVADRGLVVVRHADGISTEYEPVVPLVTAGSTVTAGAPIGRLVGTDAGCGRPHCLHWGARRGATYLDPLSLLRTLGPVRLMPWPGD